MKILILLLIFLARSINSLNDKEAKYILYLLLNDRFILPPTSESISKIFINPYQIFPCASDVYTFYNRTALLKREELFYNDWREKTNSPEFHESSSQYKKLEGERLSNFEKRKSMLLNNGADLGGEVEKLIGEMSPTVEHIIHLDDGFTVRFKNLQHNGRFNIVQQHYSFYLASETCFEP
ncbi:unnamed protein product [Caenorhabditis angaria]|uniref:Uncharacterized protein n=1 Tax=Caenorhabditis angaria TaxID=860376 RepID=A0A9P1MY01_9PELO|nr:unnamed protein product [Caenorhabditis angaria]